MKNFIVLFSLFSAKILLGQDTLKVNYDCKEYEFMIVSNKCNNDSCFGETIISITNTKTLKLISTITIDNFLACNNYESLKGSDIGLPPPILFGDFNFDNVKDLAFRNGYTVNGKPKYDFYILKNNSFELDSSLTRLSKTTGGFFFPSFEQKQLEILYLDEKGYSVREYYNYANPTKKLQLIKRITIDEKTNPEIMYWTSESYTDGIKTSTERKTLEK